MSNVLLDQLNRDLVSDAQMQAHINLIKENPTNILIQRKVADWFVGWIQKGIFDSRATTVSSYLKNNFQAHLELKADPTGLVNAIQGVFDAKATMIKTNLENLNGSTKVLLAGRQPYELEQVSKALDQIKGARNEIAEGYGDATKGEMALRFSELVNQAISDSGIHIDLSASRSEQASQLQQLQELIATKLNENQHMFTNDFIAHAKGQVTELKHETEAFHAPLINNNSKNSLLDALVGKLESKNNIDWTTDLSDKSIDLSQLSDEELAKLIGNKSEVSKLIEAKLAGYAHLEGADVVSAMKEEIKNFKPEEKALLLIRAREADAIRSVQKNHGSSLGELFNKINFSSLLSVAAIGCFGGMIFGSPVMGIMITSLLSFLGKMDSGSKPKLAAPAPDAANARSKQTSSHAVPA